LRAIVKVTFQALPFSVACFYDPLPRRGEFGELGQQSRLRRYVLYNEASGPNCGGNLIGGTGQCGAVPDLGYGAVGAGEVDDGN
jgi:hypothetical protein